jgi:integrase
MESQRLALFLELAANLADEEPVLRSRRIRNGRNQPLGEDGLAQLVGRLFSRAKIDTKGHDLRRTFATLVREASGDEFLAMRLIRDKIPSQSDQYINLPMSQLVEALEHYSPLRLIRQKETTPESGWELTGGDGGELNSPSRRSCPGYTTGLVSSFILPDSPQLTELSQASR